MNTSNSLPAAKVTVWRRMRLVESGYPAAEDDLGHSVWILDPDHIRRLARPGAASTSQIRARYTMRRIAELHVGDVSSRSGSTLASIVIAGIVLLPWVVVAPWVILSILSAAAAAAMAQYHALQRKTMQNLSPFAGQIASAGLAQGVCPCCLEHLPEKCGELACHATNVATCPRCAARWLRSRLRHPSSSMREVVRRANAAEHGCASELSIDPVNALLTDAEGVVVPLATNVRRSPSPANGLHADQLAALQAAKPRRSVHIPFMTLTTTLVVPLIIYFNTGSVTPAVVTLVTASPMGLSALLGLVVGSVLLDAYIISRALRRERNLAARELPVHLLTADLCPSCAGNLRNVVPDTQGYRTCPQCAAVWGDSISNAFSPPILNHR